MSLKITSSTAGILTKRLKLAFSSPHSCGTASDLHRTFPVTSDGCSPSEPTRRSIYHALGLGRMSFSNSSFVIRHSSFVIRHSSFVIRHSSFVIRHSSLGIAPDPSSLHPFTSSPLHPFTSSSPLLPQAHRWEKSGCSGRRLTVALAYLRKAGC